MLNDGYQIAAGIEQLGLGDISGCQTMGPWLNIFQTPTLWNDRVRWSERTLFMDILHFMEMSEIKMK